MSFIGRVVDWLINGSKRPLPPSRVEAPKPLRQEEIKYHAFWSGETDRNSVLYECPCGFWFEKKKDGGTLYGDGQAECPLKLYYGARQNGGRDN